MVRVAEISASLRLSRLAEADLAEILTVSAERWGTEARRRYAALFAAALRLVAADRQGPLTRERSDLLPGVRSFHIRDARSRGPMPRIKRPVHILYYRLIAPDIVEIVRVLHERMEPGYHMEP
jgi:toxin ParE1/3/4